MDCHYNLDKHKKGLNLSKEDCKKIFFLYV